MWALLKLPRFGEELTMQTITTIGLDIAKSVFQVHGVDAAGQVVIRRQLKRRSVLAFFQKLPPCLVGIEACASSHYWSRELQAFGHTVRLMPPGYVKAYGKQQKDETAGAEGSRNCCMLFPTRATNGYLRLPVPALPRSVLSCSLSRSRFWSLIG